MLESYSASTPAGPLICSEDLQRSSSARDHQSATRSTLAVFALLSAVLAFDAFFRPRAIVGADLADNRGAPFLADALVPGKFEPIHVRPAASAGRLTFAGRNRLGGSDGSSAGCVAVEGTTVGGDETPPPNALTVVSGVPGIGTL